MSAPAPLETEDEVSTVIVVGGRTAWVYQRKDKDGVRRGNFYVKGNVPGGEEFFRSTGFSTKGMALDAAKKLWKARLEGRLDALEGTKLRKDKPVATIGELVRAYALAVERGEIGVKKETADSYQSNLVRMVAWARGLHSKPEAGDRERIDVDAVEAMSAKILEDGQTVKDFCRHYLAPAGEDILAQDQRLRTAHSVLRNARSMFPGAVGKSARGRTSAPDLAGLAALYRGLTLPKLDAFMGAKLNTAEAVDHVMLEDSAVCAMAAAAVNLRKSQPALYAVHLLFRHLGMRNDEIEEARVEWIEKLPEPRKIFLADGAVRKVAAVMRICRRSYWKPKKSTGDVPISADVLAELQPFLEGKGALDFLVPAATATDRVELIYRTHSDFVRPWTGDRQKTSYELRRWGATKVARLHQSAEMAERFLRHAKKTTAEKHYLTEMPMPAPITLADVGL